jgi:hypothetical protein
MEPDVIQKRPREWPKILEPHRVSALRLWEPILKLHLRPRLNPVITFFLLRLRRLRQSDVPATRSSGSKHHQDDASREKVFNPRQSSRQHLLD